MPSLSGKFQFISLQLFILLNLQNQTNNLPLTLRRVNTVCAAFQTVKALQNTQVSRFILPFFISSTQNLK